jgi:hypothetical protein
MDSHYESNTQIREELEAIVQFKKNYPEQVILLLGNHDLAYYFKYSEHACSRHRPEMYWDMHELFQNNKNLFQPTFAYENYLFSHAGVSSVWLTKFLNDIGMPEMPRTALNISQEITSGFYRNNRILYQVGAMRGGYHRVGGPFWCDATELVDTLPANLHQVVGHTPGKTVRTHEWKEGNASVTFTDCVDDYYKLTI